MKICHICGKDNTMKNGGWLDAYDEEMQLGGSVYPANYVPQAQNGLEGSTDGFTDQGFNYNGAWGGTMEYGGNVPKAQDGLWNTNKTQWVDSIHNARRGDLNFVQRYFDPSAGSIPTPRDVEGWKPGQTSTHLMAYDPGTRRVYPEVVNVNGKLQYMPGDQGWNYADDTKQFIEFPTAEQAGWYANNGYKKGTNVLKGKTSTPKKAMGGNIPGSVGFTYARTKEIPDNGPYAKKTMASAQDGLSVDEQMAEASTNMWGYPTEPNFVEAYKKPTKKTTSKKTSTKSKSVKEKTDEPDSFEEKKPSIDFRANRERPQMDALRPQTPMMLSRYNPYTGYIREGDSDPNKWNDDRSIFSDARAKERGEKLWDGTKKVTALTQFAPLIGLPSKVLNTSMGLTDAYYSNREKDPINTLINIAGAMPSGNRYISGIQALSDLTDNFGFEKKPEKKQNGGEMSFYQNGLDWTPRNISKNGSEIPQAEDGEEVTLDDLLKVVNKRAASDNTNSGIQTKVSKQIGAQKSSNQKAEQQVQTLINKAGYSEPHARRAVRTKTDKQANKALENIDTDVYRTQMHPDYNPNIPVDQQSYLLNDNSLRARLLRGSNMLTNTGNPLTDFAAGMVTAPGRSFANLTMNAENRYFSPNNTGLGNFANFAEDAVNVVPSIIPKAAGALGQVPNTLSSLKNLKQEFIYNAIDPVGYGAKAKLLNAPKTFLNNTIINPKERTFRIGDNFNPSLKGRLADTDKTDPFYISTMDQINKLGKNRLDAWRTGLGLEQKYNTFTKTPEGFFRINSMSPEPRDFAALHNDIVTHKYNNSPNGFYTGEDPLIELQRRYQNIASPTIQTKYGEFNINDFLGTRKGNLKPWIQRRKVNQGSRNSDDTSIFDTDSEQGIMGGYRWDVKKLPGGDLHFQSNDTWDLHPWQERGDPNLVQDELTKKLNNLHTKNKLKNIEGLKLLGGKPYNIQNNFIIDPKTYKIKSSYEDGGIVKDDNGYWNPENWGKPVEIGSNEITMQGVNQPLIGVSDTGDVQMMYPGEDYKFDGESVTEYPVAQLGKTVPPLNVSNPNDPRLKAYNDSLSIYNTTSQQYKNIKKTGKLRDSDVDVDSEKKYSFKDYMDEYNRPNSDFNIFNSGTNSKMQPINVSQFRGKGILGYLDYGRQAQYKKPEQEVVLNPPSNVPKKPQPKPKPQPVKKKPTHQPKPVQEQPTKKPEQPIPVERKQNTYEGSPVYSATLGSGAPSALVGFANPQGDTTYIKPEDYQRYGVPAYGKELIESKTKKKKNGGWLDKWN